MIVRTRRAFSASRSVSATILEYSSRSSSVDFLESSSGIHRLRRACVKADSRPEPRRLAKHGTRHFEPPFFNLAELSSGPSAEAVVVGASQPRISADLERSPKPELALYPKGQSFESFQLTEGSSGLLMELDAAQRPGEPPEPFLQQARRLSHSHTQIPQDATIGLDFTK